MKVAPFSTSADNKQLNNYYQSILTNLLTDKEASERTSKRTQQPTDLFIYFTLEKLFFL